MLRGKRETITQIWKKMWPAALILYISYFLYRWIGVYTSQLVGQISDRLIYQGTVSDRKLLWELMVAFLFTLLLLPAIDFLTNIFIFRRGLRYEASVIGRVFKRDYESFQKHHSEEWMSRISEEPLRYRQMAVITPVRIVADGTVFVIAAVTLARTDLFLGLLLTAGVWLSVCFQLFYTKSNNRFLDENRSYQDIVKRYQIEMARERFFWRSYGCQKSLPESMKECYNRHYDRTRKAEASMGARVDFLQKAAVIGLFLASLFYGLRQIEQGYRTAGDFIAVYFLILQVRTMADSILSNVRLMRGYKALETRMRELTRGEEENGNGREEEWKQISFQNVSYFYPGTQQGMPERDFSVQYGEFMKLTGENGSGKTTLLKLLCGLFPGKNQEIWVDKSRLSDMDLGYWREKIGYVQQFPDIFPGTVGENVHIGNRKATQEQLEEVLRKVGLKELEKRSFNGGKAELSGGEIKRIELGRILLRLKQCDLLLLDEPFENLDEDGRKIVWELLNCENKSRILVSHEGVDIFSSKL